MNKPSILIEPKLAAILLGLAVLAPLGVSRASAAAGDEKLDPETKARIAQALLNVDPAQAEVDHDQAA